MPRVVKESPRQLCQLRCVSQAQASPQARALRAGPAETCLQNLPHFVSEHRAIQFSAKIFQRRRVGASRPASAAASIAHLENEVFEFQGRKWKSELHRGAFPNW